MAEEEAEAHDHCSTQIQLPKMLAHAVRTMAKRVADRDLAEHGREDDPHITVKYGLDATYQDVKNIVEQHGPFTIRLGKTSLFTGGDDGDVVKIDVESEGLRRLHNSLNALPHGDSHPEFKPHATVAYVKSGQGESYDGWDDVEGQEFVADEVMFCTKTEAKRRIGL